MYEKGLRWEELSPDTATASQVVISSVNADGERSQMFKTYEEYTFALSSRRKLAALSRKSHDTMSARALPQTEEGIQNLLVSGTASKQSYTKFTPTKFTNIRNL